MRRFGHGRRQLITAWLRRRGRQPLPGPFQVACSNVVQDFNRVAAGESASDYWEGVPRSGGGSRYVTDLLADPANTLSVAVTAPSDSSLFGSFAGHLVPYVIVVCYPTTGTNARPDYVLILAWRYAEPITRKHAPYLGRGGKFVVPLPEISVVAG